MSEIDNKRRKFLTGTTAVVGALGFGYGTIRVVAEHLSPGASERAAGAPVEADISALEPGQMMTVEWRGKPVWVIRRTPDVIARLRELDETLVDPSSNSSKQPDYCHNDNRAINDEYMVVVGICTHLGCSPTYRPELAPDDLGPDWKGGFFCPCHGSKFDLAGRVFKNVPAPTNLVVPPHQYLSDTLLLIGDDTPVKEA
jgi:ubiquinol-cytochrome c reductase iron-sulfur subunit